MSGVLIIIFALSRWNKPKACIHPTIKYYLVLVTLSKQDRMSSIRLSHWFSLKTIIRKFRQRSLIARIIQEYLRYWFLLGQLSAVEEITIFISTSYQFCNINIGIYEKTFAYTILCTLQDGSILNTHLLLMKSEWRVYTLAIQEKHSRCLIYPMYLPTDIWQADTTLFKMSKTMNRCKTGNKYISAWRFWGIMVHGIVGVISEWTD